MLHRIAAVLTIAGLTCPAVCDRPLLIGLPSQSPVEVDGDGRLLEDWGRVGVRLDVEGHETETHFVSPGGGDRVTVVEMRSRCGSCEMRARSFRAPTYPSPSDAIAATVANPSDQPQKARLLLLADAETGEPQLSPSALSAGARTLVAFPDYAEPTMKLRDWGLATDAGAQPGWARPSEPCDAAFRNIRVGWRGGPITYRFRVEPSAARTVVLGVCESHWTIPAQRPLLLQVEGAEDVRVDPVGEWGQHVPRCVAFPAEDVNSDGYLSVVSIATADAADRNSILNAIWVFPAGSAEDLDAVKRGERNGAAEHYVDVGGEADQSLYVAEEIAFDIELAPGEEQTLTFLVGTSGATAAPGVATPAEGEALLQASVGLWREWLGQGCDIFIPERGWARVWQASLMAIALTRGQASKYLVPQPAPSGAFSYVTAHEITRALDLAGLHREAESSLLMLVDSPLPEPIAKWAQTDEGAWPGEADAWAAQGRALTALVDHYSLAWDGGGLSQAYPAVKRGAEWLRTQLEENDGLPADMADDGVTWATKGLTGAAEMAEGMGAEADAYRMAETAHGIRAAQMGLPPSLMLPLPRADRSDPAKSVPYGHWAYAAMQELVDSGAIKGVKSADRGRPHREMTRYEFAMTIARLVDWRGKGEPTADLDAETRAIAVKLIQEFGPELVALADQIDDLTDDPAGLDWRVAIAAEHAAAEEGHGEYMHPAHARAQAIAEDASPQGFLGGEESFPNALAGAEYIALMRRVLVDDRTEELRLMPGVPKAWLESASGVAVEDLPTRFGPVSYRARMTSPTTLKVAVTPPPRPCAGILVRLPYSPTQPSLSVEPTGWEADLDEAGMVARLGPGRGRAILTVVWPEGE